MAGWEIPDLNGHLLCMEDFPAGHFGLPTDTLVVMAVIQKGTYVDNLFYRDSMNQNMGIYLINGGWLIISLCYLGIIVTHPSWESWTQPARAKGWRRVLTGQMVWWGPRAVHSWWVFNFGVFIRFRVVLSTFLANILLQNSPDGLCHSVSSVVHTTHYN